MSSFVGSGGAGGPDGGGRGGAGFLTPPGGGTGETVNGGAGGAVAGSSGASAVASLSSYGTGGVGESTTGSGGGGGYTSATLTVTPGNPISYFVAGGGGGGAGDTGGSDGQNGAIRLTYEAPTTVSANAGTNKTVASGGSVQIGGTDSITNGSGATSYRWVRRSGTGGSLSSTTVARPTFNAPTLSIGDPNRIIVFRKTTTNNGVSDFDDVRVTVTAPTAPPVAPSKIYVGDQRITKLYIGDEEIPTIYVGDDKVFG